MLPDSVFKITKDWLYFQNFSGNHFLISPNEPVTINDHKNTKTTALYIKLNDKYTLSNGYTDTLSQFKTLGKSQTITKINNNYPITLTTIKPSDITLSYKNEGIHPTLNQKFSTNTQEDIGLLPGDMKEKLSFTITLNTKNKQYITPKFQSFQTHSPTNIQELKQNDTFQFANSFSNTNCTFIKYENNNLHYSYLNNSTKQLTNSYACFTQYLKLTKISTKYAKDIKINDNIFIDNKWQTIIPIEINKNIHFTNN